MPRARGHGRGGGGGGGEGERDGTDRGHGGSLVVGGDGPPHSQPGAGFVFFGT